MKKREEDRLEEAAQKIRTQRQEAEELKRRRQVRVTDRVPVTKKARHGCAYPKVVNSCTFVDDSIQGTVQHLQRLYLREHEEKLLAFSETSLANLLRYLLWV